MERRLLKPKEVEKVYNIDAGTLANWRCQGIHIEASIKRR